MKKSKETQNKQFNRSNLKFTFADGEATQFEVDEKNKTVTCSIDGAFFSNLPNYEIVAKVFKRNGLECDIEDYFEYDSIIGPTQFVATVKCNENNKFDETVGKRIAESKCKAKIYIKAMKLISEIAEESEKQIHELKNLGGKYLTYFAKEKMHQFKVDYKHNGDTK